MNEIVKEETSFPGEAVKWLGLMKGVKIKRWNIAGQSVAIDSMIMINYGEVPCLSTHFYFNAVEEYQYVKSVLEDLSLCKLNDKYFKRVAPVDCTQSTGVTK